ncbi:MAG: response regulator transcription factor [Bacteroidales bacterium]|nr:response regulator transcription factor [Bacteroidales bacterium]
MKNINIIIVTDDMGFGHSMQNQLIKHDLINEVAIVSNGNEFVEILYKKNMDFAIINISSPEFNEVEYTEILQDEYLKFKIPEQFNPFGLISKNVIIGEISSGYKLRDSANINSTKKLPEILPVFFN